MDYKEAMEYLKEPIGKPLEVHDKAIKLAIKTLETQEETTGKLEDRWKISNQFSRFRPYLRYRHIRAP